MVGVRFLGFISTVLLLVGSLLVGDAFHVVFVEGEATVTSERFVGPTVIGTIILLLGYRARAPVAEAYDLTRGDEKEPEPDPDAAPTRADDPEAEFDPEMSPIGDADLDRDRDDRSSDRSDDRDA